MFIKLVVQGRQLLHGQQVNHQDHQAVAAIEAIEEVATFLVQVVVQIEQQMPMQRTLLIEI